MNIDMTDEQAKVVAHLRYPYLKNNNGIIAAIEVDETGDAATRYVIHPDGNYHAELLGASDRIIYSTLGRDEYTNAWIGTDTLRPRFYNRLTIGDLLEALLDVPERERHLPIYAYQEGQCVPLMSPMLYDESEPHSVNNPLSMTLDWKQTNNLPE